MYVLHVTIISIIYCSNDSLMLMVKLEQFNMNMMENPGDSSHCSTLNYTQAAMMGLTGSHGGQQLGYSSHGNIPNIILTGIVCLSIQR